MADRGSKRFIRADLLFFESEWLTMEIVLRKRNNTTRRVRRGSSGYFLKNRHTKKFGALDSLSLAHRISHYLRLGAHYRLFISKMSQTNTIEFQSDHWAQKNSSELSSNGLNRKRIYSNLLSF